MVSFKTRIEALDAAVISMEEALPFVLTQDLPPTQKDWHSAWVAAGNALPIPDVQELYWYDNFSLRGEFKTLPDQFSLLANVSSPGFQILDIAGWENDQRFFAFVTRDDESAPRNAVRVYMDGTLEQVTLTGFSPTRLLGYDRTNDHLWYVETLTIKFIKIGTLAITTVATAGAADRLPESQFFVIVPDGSGDAYFGARLGADTNRNLYFWDQSAVTLTNVLSTLTPVNSNRADRPLAATTGYVFLWSPTFSGAPVVENEIVQVRRSDYGGAALVNTALSVNNYAHIVDQNYAGNTIDFVYTKVVNTIGLSQFYKTATWNAATALITATVTTQAHDHLFKILRGQAKYNQLAAKNPTATVFTDVPYHVSLDYFESNSRYNRFDRLLYSPDKKRLLAFDLAYADTTAVPSLVNDIFVCASPAELSTGKIWRVSEWEQHYDDVIVVASGVNSSATFQAVDLTTIPDCYGMLELTFELYATQLSITELGSGAEIWSSNTVTISESATGLFLGSELTTNGSALRLFLFRKLFSSNLEITSIATMYIRTNLSTYHHFYADKVLLDNGATEVTALSFLLVAPGTYNWVLRAWRTEPRNPINQGSEYAPSMA